MLEYAYFLSHFVLVFAQLLQAIGVLPADLGIMLEFERENGKPSSRLSTLVVLGQGDFEPFRYVPIRGRDNLLVLIFTMHNVVTLQEIPGTSVSIRSFFYLGNSGAPPRKGHMAGEAFERFDIGMSKYMSLEMLQTPIPRLAVIVLCQSVYLPHLW